MMSFGDRGMMSFGDGGMMSFGDMSFAVMAHDFISVLDVNCIEKVHAAVRIGVSRNERAPEAPSPSQMK